MKLKFIAIITSLFLCACSTLPPQSQSISLSSNQTNILLNDIKQGLVQELKTSTEFKLDNSSEFGQILEKDLRKLGYGINPNSKNTLNYFIRQKQDKVFMHIQIDKINISRIYFLDKNKIMPLSPISITK
jgi:uncharacterized lipoprotein YajG